MTFFRPPYHGDSEPEFRILGSPYHGGKDRNGRPGSREKEIGFENREIPDFPTPPAPALRFGSMNPISKVLGHGNMGKTATARIPLGIWAKVIIPGGGTFLLIAEMEFRPVLCWPKRA